MSGFWAKNERAQGKKISEGLTVYLYPGPFWNFNNDYKKIPKFEWKNPERFAKIFRESLNLHFTFPEIFWAEELFSENNSNFLIEIGFRAEKCLSLSKQHSFCANEYLEEICVSQNNFSDFLWTYRETLSSRLSKMPPIRPKNFEQKFSEKFLIVYKCSVLSEKWKSFRQRKFCRVDETAFYLSRGPFWKVSQKITDSGKSSDRRVQKSRTFCEKTSMICWKCI